MTRFKKSPYLWLALAGLAFIVGWAVLRLQTPFVRNVTAPLSLTIDKGDGRAAVASKLAALADKNGGTLSAFEIQILAILTGKSSDFKAGDYEFAATASLSQILTKIARGDITPTRLRIAEGATWRDIKATLNKADLQHDAQNLSVTEAAQVLGVDAPSVEGMLFPDTYQYRKGEPETAVLKRAHQTLQQKLTAAWDKRAANLPYTTPYQALTMASIVEKETGTPADRPLVAAVFVNRLKINMRLQTDPTVIYGVGESFNGNLTRADLTRDTPFNTYTRGGLPPTPIATASAASINAALNPAVSDVLYFVARGDGSSEFSNNLAAHNAAVQKYQLGKK
ncbi:MAG: endolytic transglycosylase MltG [Formosimonas sp.]